MKPCIHCGEYHLGDPATCPRKARLVAQMFAPPQRTGAKAVTQEQYAAQSIAELRTKAANLYALSGGIKLDIAGLKERDPKADRLLCIVQAHLALTQDALDVLQGLYPVAP